MTDQHSSYPNGHLLVDSEWLEEHRGGPDLILLDARANNYEISHIPGAYWLNVKALKEPVQKSIVPKEQVQQLLEGFGITNESTIVIYDEGNNVLATRAFYVLEYYGLRDQLKLLNGGFAAWTAEGYEVSSDQPSPRRESSISLNANPLLITSKEELQAGLQNVILLDTRNILEYTGEDQRNNRRGGRIPGAIHKEWRDALQETDERGVTRFKDNSTLEREFAEAGLQRERIIIPYCQTNQRGAHTYFVLRLLGYPDIRPYEGSWEEWGNDEFTEIELVGRS
ncbi:sulfurtransferase [Paenibacillus agri]|uniref:thiosulfate sulfurtransferase n=1 Tax=Paenibacillus agri TaxID=2744309 RepID=A0A850EG11_9BACL|nr:sulfurtransferase [Paenibacillus agri]NUU60085.1 sulfurtransferase [Paenibacillus agri]